MRIVIVWLFAAICAIAQVRSGGQTTIAGATIDHSSATSTHPAKVASGVPASGDCDAAGEVGRMYIRSDAQAANASLYVCSRTGASTYAWELAQAASGSAVAARGWAPFGGMGQSGSRTWFALTAANDVIYIALPWIASPGISFDKVSVYFQTSGGNSAVAFYDSTCTLVAGSQTKNAAGANPSTFTFASTVTLNAGQYFFAYTADNTSDKLYGTEDGWHTEIINQGLSSPNLLAFQGANDSTGTTTLTFPGTCGSQTAAASASGTGRPAIFIK